MLLAHNRYKDHMSPRYLQLSWVLTHLSTLFTSYRKRQYRLSHVAEFQRVGLYHLSHTCSYGLNLHWIELFCRQFWNAILGILLHIHLNNFSCKACLTLKEQSKHYLHSHSNQFRDFVYPPFSTEQRKEMSISRDQFSLSSPLLVIWPASYDKNLESIVRLLKLAKLMSAKCDQFRRSPYCCSIHLGSALHLDHSMEYMFGLSSYMSFSFFCIWTSKSRNTSTRKDIWCKHLLHHV
jgi:hypothetical protein